MLLRILLVVLAVFGTSRVWAAGPMQDLFYTGKAVPLYGEAQTPGQRVLLAKLKAGHLAEGLAQMVQGTVRLKRNLGIELTSCGRVNAFYTARKSTITFCLEMLELIVKQAASEKSLTGTEGRAGPETIVGGVLWGIFLHELGHALIDIDQIPITGREEDVADQFSVYMATKVLEARGTVVVLPTIWFFRTLEMNRDLSSTAAVKQIMSDEHSLEGQRIYNIACWALGANPRIGLHSADFVELPDHRRARCAEEYQRLDYAMRRLFGKYLVLNSR